MYRRIVCAALLVCCMTTSLWAQQQRRGNRAHFEQAQLQSITKALALTDKTQSAFETLYREYQKEEKKLYDARRAAVQGKSRNMTDSQVETVLRKRLETEEALAKLRTNYYEQFRKILSPKQIMKMYQTEGKIRREVMQANQRRHNRAPQR